MSLSAGAQALLCSINTGIESRIRREGGDWAKGVDSGGAIGSIDQGIIKAEAKCYLMASGAAHMTLL